MKHTLHGHHQLASLPPCNHSCPKFKQLPSTHLTAGRHSRTPESPRSRGQIHAKKPLVRPTQNPHTHTAAAARNRLSSLQCRSNMQTAAQRQACTRSRPRRSTPNSSPPLWHTAPWRCAHNQPHHISNCPLAGIGKHQCMSIDDVSVKTKSPVRSAPVPYHADNVKGQRLKSKEGATATLRPEERRPESPCGGAVPLPHGQQNHN